MSDACSPRHKSCSPAHADLVRGYQAERWRQELALELATGGYLGDIEHWIAKGGRLIDFKAWLVAHKERR